MGSDAQSNSVHDELYRPQFREDWDSHTVYDLAEWVNGIAFRNIQFSPSGKPVIKIAEIKNGVSGQTKFTEGEYDSVYLVTDGDMLFSWSGQPETSIDIFRWRGLTGWLNQHIFKIHTKNKCQESYFFYLLKYLNPTFVRIARNKQTTGLGHVTKKDLKNITVRIPSNKNVQRAIAHILGLLDDKIELNRQMNRTLEKMAQAIFKSWFIDFDPVHAKAEGRDTGLPKDIANLFPDSFEDSELGEIPKGWEVKILSSIIELIGGGTPKTKIAEYWNGDIPWFSVVDAPNESDIWAIDTEKHVTQTGVENSSTKILPIRTTIISARGTVGKCAFVGRQMAMNQSCYGIRPADGYGEICTNFTVRNKIMALQRSGHGSVFNTITRATFDSIRIADGGYEISTTFDKLVDSYVSAILENLHEVSVLIRLRNTLLPKLISGELRVPDAEKLIEEATDD